MSIYRSSVMWRLKYPISTTGKFAFVEEYVGSQRDWLLFSRENGVFCQIDSIALSEDAALLELARARDRLSG